MSVIHLSKLKSEQLTTEDMPDIKNVVIMAKYSVEPNYRNIYTNALQVFHGSFYDSYLALYNSRYSKFK